MLQSGGKGSLNASFENNGNGCSIGGESTNCVLSGHSGYIGRIFFDKTYY